MGASILVNLNYTFTANVEKVELTVSANLNGTGNTLGVSWDAASGGGGTADQQAQFQNILAANWQ